ncbi:MAG TPA: hypothetical protein VG795_05795 [Acidimicrobiia bacterium]|nr:hypothetical protein [Acidimicrobiia bacterium]
MDENDSEPIDVIAKLTPEAAASGTSQHGAVQSRATELGISLEPLHASASDPELSTYFIVRVDPASRERVVEQLLGLDGVEGAYAKPRGEPPEGSF